MPPAVPPAFPAADGAVELLDRANGRIPGRFAGRSRVVPARWWSPGFQPWPGSLVTPLRAVRPARRVCHQS